MNLADLLNVSEYSVCVSSMGNFTSICYIGIRHALLSTYSSAFPLWCKYSCVKYLYKGADYVQTYTVAHMH